MLAPNQHNDYKFRSHAVNIVERQTKTKNYMQIGWNEGDHRQAQYWCYQKKVWCYSKNYFNCNFLNDFVSLSNCWMSKRKRLVWSAFLGIFVERYLMLDLNIPKEPLQPSQTVHKTAHNCLKPLWKISKEDFRRPDIKKIIFFLVYVDEMETNAGH